MIDALIASVRETPGDDAPRLVLADALQARGDLWGEIISLSCRYEGLDRASAEAHAVRERILAMRSLRWPSKAFVGTIVRGFFDLVWANDAGVAQVRGPEHALLRRLRVRKATDAGLDALVGLPALAHVDELRIDADGPGTPSRAVAAVADAACRTLRLSGLDLSAAELNAMFAGPLGGAVRHLQVSQKRAPIAAASRWPALDSLALSHGIDDGDVAMLLGAPELLDLRALDLFYNPLGDRALETVAATPFTQLASLRLAASEASEAGIAALSRAGHLRRLTALALDWNRSVTLEPAHLTELARFDQLTELELAMCATAPALRAMYAALEAPLQRLRVAAAVAGPAAVPPLERPSFAGLRSLALSFQPIGDRGAELIACAELPQLAALDLASCQIGPAGALALTTSTTLPRGLHLNLYGNDLGPHVAALRARYSQVESGPTH